ncbi:anti-sigma regulatory factor [Nocardioides salsibiostraticola]
MAQTDPNARSDKTDVDLRLPADSAYLSVVRTTAAGLAARLDFTIDDIEDLRMAVGEASAIVLSMAEPDSDLQCGFHLESRRITVSLSVDAATGSAPDYDDFAWQVLTTLATATVDNDTGRFTVTLALTSAVGATGV